MRRFIIVILGVLGFYSVAFSQVASALGYEGCNRDEVLSNLKSHYLRGVEIKDLNLIYQR